METEILNLQKDSHQNGKLVPFEEDFSDIQFRKLSQASKNSFSSTLTCPKQQNIIKQKQNSIPRKKTNGIKRIKKQKHKNNQLVIQKIINSEDPIRITTGFTINNQGIVKFSYEIAYVSFGDQQIEQTKFLQNEQIFQIHLINSEQKPNIQIEQALEYILHTPCKYSSEARNALLQFKQLQRFFLNVVESTELSTDVLQFQNQELQKHIESCSEYIQQYARLNEEKMFYYQIGSVNFQEKDIDILQSGYSKSFLDLIGLSVQNLSFLLLRNQKIDLFKDQDEMMRQSLIQFTNNNQQKETKTSYIIKTFDGFDIKLEQTKKLFFPSYQAQKISKLPLEYIFFIIEFDVELRELENLINYRQKIMSISSQLTFDEFINKELSLQFENVEYSVLSNSLIDKFYKNNLNYLNNMHEYKRRRANKQ
ncbi:hypothetical protein ABPG72_009352 [Tetrahymena utriculariae]